ncbi:MAG: ArnT family glycosyltransferase [Janthinobacterium lividum]
MLLAGITAALGLPLVLRCVLDVQINYNEGWNAYRQQAAALGQPLYGTPPGFAVTNYPPISFHLVGFLGWFCGDMVLAGRLTSLLAIALIALVLSRIGRCLSGSGAVGACCGLCWLAGVEFWTPERIGTNDPQLLAIAFQAVGLLAFLRQPARSRFLLAAAMLIAVGLFTKHNLLALPVGMTLSLAVRAAWRELAVWILAGAASCVVLFAATIAVDGRLFLANMLTPRAFLPAQELTMSLSYMLFAAPVLVAAAAWAWRERGSAVSSLSLSWIASLLEIVAFAGGDGVAGNIFQDAIMMSALLQPLALQQLLAQRHAGAGRRSSGGLLVWLSLMVVPLFLVERVPATWRAWHALSQQQVGFRQGVALLRDQSGPVMCETLLLCFRAGKPSAFDAYYVQDEIRLGRLSASTIDRLLQQHLLAAIAIGSSEDPESSDPAHLPWRFSRSFMEALWTHYRPVLTTANFTIFLPDETYDYRGGAEGIGRVR